MFLIHVRHPLITVACVQGVCEVVAVCVTGTQNPHTPVLLAPMAARKGKACSWVQVSCVVTPQNGVLGMLTQGPGGPAG